MKARGDCLNCSSVWMQVLPAFTNYRLQRHSFHGNKRTIDIHATFLPQDIVEFPACQHLYVYGLVSLQFLWTRAAWFASRIWASAAAARRRLGLHVLSANLCGVSPLGAARWLRKPTLFCFKLGNMEAIYGKIGKSMGPQFPMFFVGFGLWGIYGKVLGALGLIRLLSSSFFWDLLGIWEIQKKIGNLGGVLHFFLSFPFFLEPHWAAAQMPLGFLDIRRTFFQAKKKCG